MRVNEPELSSTERLHNELYELNVRRLRPADPSAPFDPEADACVMRLEEGYLQAEQAAVRSRAEFAPRDPRAFVEWFTSLRQNGPGQHDALFPWLAERCNADEMRWFLGQELATEAGFDDLVAMTQRRLPSRAKLELANNYWDEMGRGHPHGMHGPMLDALSRELDLGGLCVEPAWEALAVCNTLMGLAYNRRWAYHSVGALGVVELTAPDRCAHVKRGLTRLGVSKVARRYYSLHAIIDVRHYAQWSADVLEPLVAEDPRRATWMAEGALMRLDAGARTFERYRQHLWAA